MNRDFHLTAAAFHLSAAAALDGTPLPATFNVNDPATWWPAMKEQAFNNTLPHPFQEFGKDTPLPERAGTGEMESPLYEKLKPFWKAMQRDLVPDSRGEPFGYLNCIERGNRENGAGGGTADFEREMAYLWTSKKGMEWRLDKRNIEAGLVPEWDPPQAPEDDPRP